MGHLWDLWVTRGHVTRRDNLGLSLALEACNCLGFRRIWPRNRVGMAIAVNIFDEVKPMCRSQQKGDRA